MSDLHFKSARQLASDIRRGKISAVEALDAFLARVDRFNPRLNAIIAMDVEGARRRAKTTVVTSSGWMIASRPWSSAIACTMYPTKSATVPNSHQ